MAKILMSMRIDKKLKHKLARIAIKKGVSMTAIISILIAEYIEKESK